MEIKNPNTQKYSELIADLDDMIANRGRGYEVAQALNDQFWEELSTHKERMMEQMDHLQNRRDAVDINESLAQADSIYEAARAHISKVRAK